MRRIIMFNRVTADGYFAGPHGDLDWVVPDEEIDKGAARGMSDRGTILFGRRTYEMFASFWPHVAADAVSAPNPHAARQRSPEMRAMAGWLNAATKFVFSTTLREVTWTHAQLRSTLDRAEIEAMKAQAGGDIFVFGSGSLVSQLTEYALIDEYQFVVTPLLLGSGRPLIEGVARRLPLALVEATAYASGTVMLRYRRES